MVGKIYAEGMSVRGQREENQDRYVIFDKRGHINKISKGTDERIISVERGLIYFAVADGIGSLKRGGESAELAIKSIVEWVENYDIWKEDNPDCSLEIFIKEGFSKANKILVSEELSGKGKMGTTLTVLLIKDDEYYCASVGDSPAYKISSESVERLTDTPNNRNNALKYYIGNKYEDGYKMTRLQTGLCKMGDVFVLCTDGLMENYEDEITSYANQKRNTYAKELYNKVFVDNPSDNCTMIKIFMDRMNTTMADDRVERCESIDDYKNNILSYSDRIVDNWYSLIAGRTSGYAMAEVVHRISDDWGVTTRTVRGWLNYTPSRDNVIKICASLGYSSLETNKVLEHDAHYSKLDATNTVDFAWASLLDDRDNLRNREGNSMIDAHLHYMERAEKLKGPDCLGDVYENCITLLQKYMKEEDLNTHRIWEDHNSYKKAREYLSGKPKNGQLLPRYFLVAFSLYVGLSIDGINGILVSAGMRRISSKNIFEQYLYYTLQSLELEEPYLFADILFSKYDNEGREEPGETLVNIVIKRLEELEDEVDDGHKSLYSDCLIELKSYLSQPKKKEEE